MPKPVVKKQPDSLLVWEVNPETDTTNELHKSGPYLIAKWPSSKCYCLTFREDTRIMVGKYPELIDAKIAAETHYVNGPTIEAKPEPPLPPPPFSGKPPEKRQLTFKRG